MSPVWIEDAHRPQGGRHQLLVRYAKFTGTDAGACEYIEMQSCLLLEYLKNKEPGGDVQRVLDEMILASFRESSKQDIIEIFRRGVYLRGRSDRRYNFLGHSREQLKDKTCLLIRKTPQQIYDILTDFADFHLVEPIEKRADQIGALFSCFTHSDQLREDEFDDLIDGGQKPQGEQEKSPKMSKAIKILFHPSPVPSVMEARCRADQCVLLHANGTVSFTRSMEALKVKGLPDVLGIMDYSKPYSMGYLDTLSAMMLEMKGVAPGYMERLQIDYHRYLNATTQDVDSVNWFLTRMGKIDYSMDLCNVAADGARDIVKEIQQEEIRKIKEEGTFNDSNGKERRKARVLVLKSREVLGFHDPYSHLKPDECFFDPVLPNEESEDFKLARNLLIMHRPCYSPDHIYSLKLVHKSDVRAADYAEIRDCLVLGDSSVLGDKKKYFVSWDENLIPRAASRPLSIRWKNYLPSPALLRVWQWLPPTAFFHPASGCAFSSCFGLCRLSSSLTDEARRKTNERDLLLHFFASFDDLFSQAEEQFMRHATADGPSSNKCRRLSDLLCGGVDPYTQTKEAERIIEEVKHMQNPVKRDEAEDGEAEDSEAEDSEAEDSDAEEQGERAALIEQSKIWYTMGKKATDFIEEMNRSVLPK